MAAGRVARPTARTSVASWFGTARHAHALRLSRAIFTRRDVRNLGKRLVIRIVQIVATIVERLAASPATGRDAS